MLLNLLQNALDVTIEPEVAGHPADRPIRISTAIQDDTVSLSVRDHGAGLVPGIAERLFQPFTSTKPGGLGLGLYICRTIVERSGGRIWGEAAPGGGRVVGFSILAMKQGAGP